jgi:hypothetical protein
VDSEQAPQRWEWRPPPSSRYPVVEWVTALDGGKLPAPRLIWPSQSSDQREFNWSSLEEVIVATSELLDELDRADDPDLFTPSRRP